MLIHVPDARRLLLRAELSRGDQRVVAHTVQVSPEVAFVWTALEAEPGERLGLELSFPELLAPITLDVTVDSRHVPKDPGDPAGLMARFVRDGPGIDRLDEFFRGLDAALASDVEGEAPDGSYKVLFVEDSDLMRQMFTVHARRYFKRRKASVEVDIASDAEQAWELFDDNTYDLALVDFFLPGQLGSELVKKIRATDGLGKVTCVGVSVGGTEARDAFLSSGAHMYLDKPMVLQDLFATLEVLSVARALRAA